MIVWFLLGFSEIVGFAVAVTKYCIMVHQGVVGYERIEVLIWMLGLAIIFRIKLSNVNTNGNKNKEETLWKH